MSSILDSLKSDELLYIRSFLCKKLYDYQDVDDALQTTLLEAHKSSDSFRGDAMLKVWICGIALNVARKYNAHYKRSSDTIPINSIHSNDFEYDADPLIEASISAESIYLSYESFNAIDVFVRNTSFDKRCVFIDSVYNGMSYKDISNKYSIPIGTVKSRISGVRNHIRDSLDHGVE